MKKLMMAVAIVCAAAAVQAANINWKIAGQSFKMADGETLPDSTKVYLVDTSAATWSDSLASIVAGEITADNIDKQSFYVGQNTTYHNDMSVLMNYYYGKVDEKPDASADVAKNAGTSKYAIIVWDDDNVLVSQSVDGTAWTASSGDGSAAGFVAADFADAASQTGGWVATSVPEPTSGLLLLLGVAGLALRRRRA